MAIINPVILGGAQSSDEWQRPSDWLPIPEIASGEEVIYILMAVYDVVGNFAALKIEGNYNVDWGDGTILIVSSGVKAEHSYDWDDVGDVTSEGFRQALIKITPQAGENITLVDLQEYHSTVGPGRYSQFIDVIFNIPNLGVNLLIIGNGNGIYHKIIERIWIKEIGTITNMYRMFYNLQALQSVPIFDTTDVINMTYMFSNCYSLQSIPLFDTSNVLDMYHMFSSCYSLRNVPLFDTSNVVSMYYMFQYCYCLKYVPLFDTSSVLNIYSMFFYCNCLQSIPSFDLSNVINANLMFSYCYSLKRCPLLNARISLSFTNNQLSAEAIDELGNGVTDMTGESSPTVTLTGNYGTTGMDTTIWTAKNWTVIT